MHMLHCRNPAGKAWVGAFFVAQHWTGEVRINEPEKHGDLQWLPLEDLPEKIFPYVSRVLAHERGSASRIGTAFSVVRRPDSGAHWENPTLHQDLGPIAALRM